MLHQFQSSLKWTKNYDETISKALASNIGLIKNNVAVASKIALHLNGMSGKKSEVVITKPPIASKIFRMGTPPKITVIGATAIDLTGKPEIPLQKDTSAPGVISVSC